MQSIRNLGADVDSRFIAVACAERSFATTKIGNERKAIGAWLRGVPRGSRLAMESTGGYHELLANMANKAGLQVFVINPRNLRKYAQGIGQRGKTDRIDAEVIARYVSREHDQLHAYVPATKDERMLAKLIARRGKLVAVRGTILQSLRRLPSVERHVKDVVAKLDRLIAELERLTEQTLARVPAAQHAAQHLTTIPGFGVLSATCLSHNLTRLPYSSGDAAVAQTGLDPRPNDSGKKQGRRRLSKCGPSEQRRLLFMAARSASRMKLWRPYYERDLAKGLSSTAATNALARRMVRVAFALIKHDRPFDPALMVSPA
jgi:transposase